MTARRTLAIVLTTSVVLAGLVTATASASGAAPSAKVQPRTAVTNTSAYAIIKTTPIYYANGVAVNDADDTVYVSSAVTISTPGNVFGFDGRDWDDSTVGVANPGAWAVAVDQSDDTVWVTNGNGLCAFRGVDLTYNPNGGCTSGKGPMSAVAVDQGDDTVYGVVESQSKIFTFEGRRNPAEANYSPIVSSYSGDGGGAAVDNDDDTLYVPTGSNLTLSRYSGPSTSVVNPPSL